MKSPSGESDQGSGEAVAGAVMIESGPTHRVYEVRLSDRVGLEIMSDGYEEGC